MYVCIYTYIHTYIHIDIDIYVYVRQPTGIVLGFVDTQLRTPVNLVNILRPTKKEDPKKRNEMMMMMMMSCSDRQYPY